MVKYLAISEGELNYSKLADNSVEFMVLAKKQADATHSCGSQKVELISTDIDALERAKINSI